MRTRTIWRILIAQVSKPSMLNLRTPDDFRRHASELDKYENERESRQAAIDAYNAESRRLEDLFKRDALDDVGLFGHPKAEKAFNMAWDRGHSAGYSEVYSELQDLAELLVD